MGAILVTVEVCIAAFVTICLLQLIFYVPYRVDKFDKEEYEKREENLTANIHALTLEKWNLVAGLPELDLEIKELAFNAFRSLLKKTFAC